MKASGRLFFHWGTGSSPVFLGSTFLTQRATFWRRIPLVSVINRPPPRVFRTKFAPFPYYYCPLPVFCFHCALKGGRIRRKRNTFHSFQADSVPAVLSNAISNTWNDSGICIFLLCGTETRHMMSFFWLKNIEMERPLEGAWDAWFWGFWGPSLLSLVFHLVSVRLALDSTNTCYTHFLSECKVKEVVLRIFFSVHGQMCNRMLYASSNQANSPSQWKSPVYIWKEFQDHPGFYFEGV